MRREILYDDALQMVKHALELAFPVPSQPVKAKLREYPGNPLRSEHEKRLREIQFDKENRAWRDHRKEQIKQRHKIFNQTRKDLNY